MDSDTLKQLLAAVKSGTMPIERAIKHLSDLPSENLGFARIDHHRALRQGIPEVIFASGKTPDEVVAIAKAMKKKSNRFLITRATEAISKKLRMKGTVYHPAARTITFGGTKDRKGMLLIISAGTSDIPVAEEAAVTAEFLGSRVEKVYDAGVAGIHRLFEEKKLIDESRVIIVTAGMEGALPSVVGGLTNKPIIAVPTSVGYGTSFGGLTALFAMLNSCVPGIAVVNIDNGFGAACLAHKINIIGKQ